MNKLLLHSMWLVLAGALFAAPVWAADLTFSCDSDNSDCGLSSTDPIFDVDNMLPGETVIKTLEVKNESSVDDCNFFLRLSDRSVQPVEFDNRLFTAVRDKDGNDKYGATDGDTAKDDKKLHDMFGGSEVDMIGVISAGATQEYKWFVTFDTAAGNEFMNAEISFAANLTGECGEETPTPTPPPGAVAGASTNGPGGTVLGAALAPTGVWRERALWLAMLAGLIMMMGGIYVWERSKNRANAAYSR